MAIFLLVVPTAFPQHSGGFARGSGAGRGFAGHGTMTRRTTSGSAGRFRSRFIGSYAPLSGGFGLWGGYPYAEEPPPVPDAFVMAPAAGQTSPQPAAPVRPAQSVMHEYKWPKNEETGGGATAFTIALKDGSQHLAVAAWIQGGKLNYLDSEDRQQALSSDVIDRQTTDRLNQEKHLRLQLPPG